MAVILVLAACSLNVAAQTSVPQTTAYVSVLENPHLHAFRLELPASGRAPVYSAHHDQIWVAISPVRIKIEVADGGSEELDMDAGTARFFPAHRMKTVANESAATVEMVVVELKHSSDVAQGCQCTGVVATKICGCRGIVRLPPLWAVSLGDVTIAGTTLNAGQSCCTAVPRGDTLLVAISSLELSYAAAEDASQRSTSTTRSRLKLQPGAVVWLGGGRRDLVNVGEAPARFVSIELD